MKRAIIALLVLMYLAPICKAESQIIVVEVNRMTNVATNGVFKIDNRTNPPVSVSIRSVLECEQRENVSINDAVKVLKDGIAPIADAISVIVVLHEGVRSCMVSPLVKAIIENDALDLVDLRSLGHPVQADYYLKLRGIKLRPRDEGVKEQPKGDRDRDAPCGVPLPHH